MSGYSNWVGCAQGTDTQAHCVVHFPRYFGQADEQLPIEHLSTKHLGTYLGR